MHVDGGTRYDKKSVEMTAIRMRFVIKKHKLDARSFASLDGYIYKIVDAISEIDARGFFNAIGKIYPIVTEMDFDANEKDTYTNQMFCRAVYDTAAKGVTHFFKDDIGVFLGAKEYDKTSFLTKPLGNFW